MHWHRKFVPSQSDIAIAGAIANSAQTAVTAHGLIKNLNWVTRLNAIKWITHIVLYIDIRTSVVVNIDGWAIK